MHVDFIVPSTERQVEPEMVPMYIGNGDILLPDSFVPSLIIQSKRHS